MCVNPHVCAQRDSCALGCPPATPLAQKNQEATATANSGGQQVAIPHVQPASAPGLQQGWPSREGSPAPTPASVTRLQGQQTTLTQWQQRPGSPWSAGLRCTWVPSLSAARASLSRGLPSGTGAVLPGGSIPELRPFPRRESAGWEQDGLRRAPRWEQLPVWAVAGSPHGTVTVCSPDQPKLLHGPWHHGQARWGPGIMARPGLTQWGPLTQPGGTRTC